MARNSKEVNIGDILREAGLISPAQLARAFQEQHSTGSSLVEILTKKRYISLQSLVDLLTYEIPMPFGGNDADKALKNLLLDSGLATEDELQRLIDESELGQMLVRSNQLKKFQLELARQEQAKSGLPLWRTLINLRFLTPNDMYAVLKDQMYRAHYPNLDEFVGEILVNTKQLSKEQLKEAQQKQIDTAKSLGKILIEEGLISAAGLANALGDSLKIPVIDLAAADIELEAAALLPESYLREHHALPFKKERGEDEQPPRLLVAMIDPLDIAARDNIGLMTGCDVMPVLTTEKALTEKLAQLFPEESVQGILSREQALKQPPTDGQPLRASVIPFIETDERSIVKLVTAIIEGAINGNATDIHLEPQANEELRARYRIDGLLHDVLTISKQAHPMVISRIKVLADMDITERRQAQDGHITMSFGNVEYYMRIGTLPTKLGERLVIRLLNERRVLTGLKQLGFEADDLRLVEQFIAMPYGMILVTGPVGSGKTTTLYAALNEINILTKSLITIEDPVEYQLPGITQVEVDPKIGLTFAAGLRAILRQDPNTLMVGEIRDPETASVAIRAALTGQQLFSTLHTQDAAGAITTLSYLGAQPFWIASALVGVIAQRLVRTICPHCKERYRPEPRLLKLLQLEQDAAMEFTHGNGCEKCFHSGYFGRTGIFEVMNVNEALREQIVKQIPEAALKEQAIFQGMHTLKTSGIQKIKRGETTVEETLRVIL